MRTQAGNIILAWIVGRQQLLTRPAGRYAHTAIWNGSEMIIWGGSDGSFDFNTGGRYTPGTDTWIDTGIANAPQERDYHTAVWTGSEMIVWGGEYALGYPYEYRREILRAIWSLTIANSDADSHCYTFPDIYSHSEPDGHATSYPVTYCYTKSNAQATSRLRIFVQHHHDDWFTNGKELQESQSSNDEIRMTNKQITKSLRR